MLFELLKLAHSLRLVLPNNTAPAFLNCAIIKASFFAILPFMARAPAVVIIVSPVLILSFTKTGMPCSGPLILPALRSLSMAAAMVNASLFISITAFKRGPALSSSAILLRYSLVMATEVVVPAFICCCNTSIVISSNIKSLIGAAARLF